jgi:hypothetical protein
MDDSVKTATRDNGSAGMISDCRNKYLNHVERMQEYPPEWSTALFMRTLAHLFSTKESNFSCSKKKSTYLKKTLNYDTAED